MVAESSLHETNGNSEAPASGNPHEFLGSQHTTGALAAHPALVTDLGHNGQNLNNINNIF